MSSSSSCDVLVIGAGPAGSAAARMLSDSGHQVTIADQRSFPRDKVCGDGLISDALAALMILGAEERVQAEAWHGSELRVYAPGGAHVALRGKYACLPRERFDAILLDHAVAGGATFLPDLTAVAPHVEHDRVAGARFRSPAGEVSVRARFTILATGANATALDAFGLPGANRPDAVAGRAYFEAPPEVASRVRHLSIVYQRDWCPGYGWVFPGPGNRFNIGVGLFRGRGEGARLREFWEMFRRRFGPAASLIEASTQVSEFRGAPLRSGLRHEQFGRPGLLAAGETIATSYSATGEGIGKAMESGMLAAVLISESLTGARPAERLEDAYRDAFRTRFLPRYRAYRTAQRWASSPRIVDMLARSASRGRFVRSEIEALVAERGDARALFSFRGLLKALVR